ncbi:caspase-3-like [Ornithodoros turicata]|uniref:caspase-3-like n=1 Tax=Ornithodoros turicata TaxID=34597 RepID=UPI003139AD36
MERDSVPAGGPPSEKDSHKTWADGTDSGALGVLPDREDDNYYPRGKMKCVIFNLRQNDNTEEVEKLKTMFQSLSNVAVEAHVVKEADEVIDKLQELAKEENLADIYTFLCWIISADCDKHTLKAAGKVLEFDSIYQPFASDQCKGLYGKPKIFFFQVPEKKPAEVCKTDGDVDTASLTEIQAKIPKMTDFYYAFSSAPGYFGSGCDDQFVRIVTEMFDEKVPEEPETIDLSAVMIYVLRKAEELGQGKERPCVMSSLTGHVALSKVRSTASA